MGGMDTQATSVPWLASLTCSAMSLICANNSVGGLVRSNSTMSMTLPAFSIECVINPTWVPGLRPPFAEVTCLGELSDLLFCVITSGHVCDCTVPCGLLKRVAPLSGFFSRTGQFGSTSSHVLYRLTSTDGFEEGEEFV